MIKFLVFFLCFDVFASSKYIHEEVRIIKMQWNDNKKLYRLDLYGHAAVYWGAKNFSDCLIRSLKKNNPVSVSFLPQDRIINTCKELKQN